jgi:hypothetical protein
MTGPEVTTVTDAIDGVLIEGVDYVGKTTVCGHLARLAGVARPVSVGRCYLHRTPLIEFLERAAADSDDMIVRDHYYTAALVSDIAMPRRLDDYRVQDRHWLTQLGRNTFFHSGPDVVPPSYFLEAHRPFARNVLLTSSAAAKADRAAQRPPKSPRDGYLRAHPQVHQEYETFLRTLLPPTEDWLELDTTGLPADEVARRVLDYCGLSHAAGAA